MNNTDMEVSWVIGVPLFIIYFRLGFYFRTHPAIEVARPIYGNPHVDEFLCLWNYPNMMKLYVKHWLKTFPFFLVDFLDDFLGLRRFE